MLLKWIEIKGHEKMAKKRQNIREKISNWNEQSMDDIWFLFKRTFLLPLHGLPEKCEQKNFKNNNKNNNKSCKDTINALFFFSLFYEDSFCNNIPIFFLCSFFPFYVAVNIFFCVLFLVDWMIAVYMMEIFLFLLYKFLFFL